MVGPLNQESGHEAKRDKAASDVADKGPLTILYGSNARTWKAFADELVAEATDFEIALQTLDAASEKFTKKHSYCDHNSDLWRRTT